MFGLFTRFWAAAAAIEMGIISWIYLKNGIAWLNRGYEYVLLWGRSLRHSAARRRAVFAGPLARQGTLSLFNHGQFASRSDCHKCCGRPQHSTKVVTPTHTNRAC